MLKICVLVSGGGTNLQAIIDACESGYVDGKVCHVISSSVKAYALERAKRHNIPSSVIRKKDYSSADAYTQAVIDSVAESGAELVIMAGFMSILGDQFVQAFPNRIMNIHPSLIPSFCGKGFYGLHVHEAALARGVKITGATVHFINEVCDGGPIIIQKAIEVLQDDTPESLQLRIMKECEQKILPEAVKLFAEGKLTVEGNIVRRSDR